MAAVVIADPNRKWYEDDNDWVLMSRNLELIESLASLDKGSTLSTSNDAWKIRWTDDFSNLFDVIDWNG